MPDYKITTDSTTDITPELVDELELHVIPMIFTVDGRITATLPTTRILTPMSFMKCSETANNPSQRR